MKKLVRVTLKEKPPNTKILKYTFLQKNDTVKYMRNYYFATVGIYTKPSVIYAIRYLNCSRIYLFSSSKTKKQANDIKAVVEDKQFSLKYGIKNPTVMVKEIESTGLWQNVNVIINTIVDIFKKEKEPFDIFFDISGGTRTMSLSLLLAASYTKIGHVYYFLQELDNKGIPTGNIIPKRIPRMQVRLPSESRALILKIMCEKGKIAPISKLGKLIKDYIGSDNIKVGRSKGKISKHINALKEMGFVKVYQDPLNKRVYICEKTADGEAMLNIILLLKQLMNYKKN